MNKILKAIAALGAKKLAVIGVLTLTLTGAAVGGGLYVANSNADEAREKALADTTIVEKDGEKIRVDENGNEVKVTEDGEVKIVEKDAVSEEEAKEATSNSNSNSSSNSGNSSSSSGNSGGSSSSNSGGSSNGGSSSSGSSSTPTAPVHTHSWTAVYKTVSVPVEESYRVSVCNACDTESPSLAHLEAHAQSFEVCGTHSETRYRTVYTEEQRLSHYQCSCGATK